jgi:hypothetical protein
MMPDDTSAEQELETAKAFPVLGQDALSPMG